MNGLDTHSWSLSRIITLSENIHTFTFINRFVLHLIMYYFLSGKGNVDREATAEAAWKTHLETLVKCDNCGRTFFPDRLAVHQKSCLREGWLLPWPSVHHKVYLRENSPSLITQPKTSLPTGSQPDIVTVLNPSLAAVCYLILSSFSRLWSTKCSARVCWLL